MSNSDKKGLKAASTQRLEDRRKEILVSLPTAEHVIRGSLIKRTVKCGKPTCHCATGDGHQSSYLSSFYHGHTHMDYVPAAWEPWVSQGIANYGSLQNLLSELTELNLELFRRRGKSS